MNPGEYVDGDLDLYDDILVEDLTDQQESLHKVQIKYQEALKRITVLEEMTKQNEMDIVNLRKKNSYLMKNISVLYKTACTELERKKEVIDSLQNQVASGYEYEYAGNGRGFLPSYPCGSNIFEHHNVENYRPNGRSITPYENLRYDTLNRNHQYGDSHLFYTPHSSNYPNDDIPTSTIDSPNSIQDCQSPYTYSNILNQEKSEKHIYCSNPHVSHTGHMTEPTNTDSYTSPVWNTESHSIDRDSSFHASQYPNYSDEHTPRTKQAVSNMPHSGKNSNSNQSGRKPIKSTPSHSTRLGSKTPTSSSSHTDKRSSSSKHSHSDSRKHHPHHSSSRTSSQSKHSESKKSGHSSKVSSKNREPSSSSSSSSRSRHKQSHSNKKSETKGSHHSKSKCKKSQSEKQRERKVSVDTRSAKKVTLVHSKRKLPQEFSGSATESKAKRRQKEKSKVVKQNLGQSSEVEPDPKSHPEEEELCEESSEVKPLSPKEGNSSGNLERNEDVPNCDIGKESPLEKSQFFMPGTDQKIPIEPASLPYINGPFDASLQNATESVAREAENTVPIEQKHPALASVNNGLEPSSAEIEGETEKDLDECELLDTENKEACSPILWANKDLSDSDENSTCPDGAATLDVESLTDTHSSSKKEENSSHNSDISDDKSDALSSPQKIVIQCFGSAHDDSRSPIIIPCYPSKKSQSKSKSNSCSSASDNDEECDSEGNITSKSLIARTLFPLTELDIEKSSERIDSCTTPDIKVIPNLGSAFDNSITDKDENGSTVEKFSLDPKTEENPLSDIHTAEPEKFSLDPEFVLTTEEANSDLWQDEDTELSNSEKKDYQSDSTDDNNNENCFRPAAAEEPLRKDQPCSDDELEEGELLTDEENESAVDGTVTTAPARIVRSQVRYHKSLSPLKCRKDFYKRDREVCRRRPYREPMKSDSHNRQRRSTPPPLPTDRFVSKTRSPLLIGKRSWHRDSRRSQNNIHSFGSGSRYGQSERRHRQSGFRYKSGSHNSSSANRKRTTH